MRIFSEDTEQYWVDLVTGRTPERLLPLRDRWLLHGLKGLSWLYSGGVESRLWLYRLRLFRHHTLGVQIISVGNLTVGGTGKTPVVEAFARALLRQGRRVAVLSRGYRRLARGPSWRDRLRHLGHSDWPPPCVVSDGVSILATPQESGDEPYMLARRLPGVVVLVDPDRVKSGRYAIKRLKCNTLVLDDGFQHPELKHRLDIVLVDSQNPWGNGYLLPRGVLRERKRNIARASYIFLTKCTNGVPTDLVRQLRKLNPRAELIACRHQPRHLQDIRSGDIHPLESLRNRPVALLSGIAAPDSFEKEIVRFGARPLLTSRFPDHHWYTADELRQWLREARRKGAELAVTTEKDAVRFPPLGEVDLAFCYLRMEIELADSSESMDACVARICSRPVEG